MEVSRPGTETEPQLSMLDPFWGVEGLFRATPVAYGSFQAGGRIGGTAASLCHRHSHAGSKLKAYICDLNHSSRPHWTLNPLSKARD